MLNEKMQEFKIINEKLDKVNLLNKLLLSKIKINNYANLIFNYPTFNYKNWFDSCINT